jgi:uncharacterized membrane protein
MYFQVIQKLRSLISSYWFIPGGMSVSAIVTALCLGYVDSIPEFSEWFTNHSPLQTTPTAARSVLTIIAGSAISVAGVVFSITILVLNMAAAQFGPRLLANFMEHPGTQFVLGAFLGTFTYSLVMLTFIREGEGQEIFVPQLGTSFGIVSGIISFLMLIYFINHVAVFIQAAHVIDSVSLRMSKVMKDVFPHHDTTASSPDDEEDESSQAENDACRQLLATQSGYIQAYDFPGLLELAEEHDLHITLKRRAGHFIMSGETLLAITPDKELDEDTEQELIQCVALGVERVLSQDPEFAVHQLVEIALRALSPGINDPYTAINCIDRLAAVLAEMASRRLPSRYLCDDAGRRRVTTSPFTYVGMVDAAFDQLRQHAAGQAAVTFRLVEIIERLAKHPGKDPGRNTIPQPFREALSRQLDAICHLNRNGFDNPIDHEEYEHRIVAARDALHGEND